MLGLEVSKIANRVVLSYRSKGLIKQLRPIFKDMPDYVFNDTIRNNLSLGGQDWINELVENWQDSGLSLEDYAVYAADHDSDNLFSLLNYKWSEEVIKVNLYDFTKETRDLIFERDFGRKNPNGVPRDEERTNLQREKATGDGQNEPVVVVMDGRKYNLIEGWHRTMALLESGKNGSPDPLKWGKVKIRAWVGKK